MASLLPQLGRHLAVDVKLARRRRSRLGVLFYVLACAGSATGCAPEDVPLEQVPGYYKFSTGRGEDILLLCADGTLVHTERGIDASVRTERGRWSMEGYVNKVALNNITLRRDVLGTRPPEIGARESGLFVLGMEVARDGNLVISTNPDELWGYVRQPNWETRKACTR